MLNVVMFLVALQLSAAMTMDDRVLLEKVSSIAKGSACTVVNFEAWGVKGRFEYAVMDLLNKTEYLDVGKTHYQMTLNEQARAEKDSTPDRADFLKRANCDVCESEADLKWLEEDYHDAVAKKEEAEQEIREFLSRLEDQ